MLYDRDGTLPLGVKKWRGIKAERAGGSKERKWEGPGRCKEERDASGRRKLRSRGRAGRRRVKGEETFYTSNWGVLARVGTLVRRMEPGVMAGCSAMEGYLELVEGELED